MRTAMCSFRRTVPLLTLSIHAPLAFSAAEPRPLDPPPHPDRGTGPRTEGRDGSPPAEVGIRADGDTLVLTNALLAVRVPKMQQRKGVAAKDLPAPIVAFQSAGGPWRGAGRMMGKAAADSFRVIQVAAGPVRAEIQYEIDCTNGGTYRCTVRVDARETIAEVIEEYDLKGAPYDVGWELDLAAGWQPQLAEWIRAMAMPPVPACAALR